MGQRVHETIKRLLTKHGGEPSIAEVAQTYYEEMRTEYRKDPATHHSVPNMVIDELHAEIGYWRARATQPKDAA